MVVIELVLNKSLYLNNAYLKECVRIGNDKEYDLTKQYAQYSERFLAVFQNPESKNHTDKKLWTSVHLQSLWKGGRSMHLPAS